MKPTKFFAERVNYGDTVYLHIAAGSDEMRGDRLFRAKPIEMYEVEHGMPPDVPAIEMRTSSAQRLIDELWSIGLRPTQMIEGEGERGAMKDHIADLRAIAFKSMGIEDQP